MQPLKSQFTSSVDFNMTRKLQNHLLDEAKGRKKIMKPAVEKKRRDRINQSLAELRTLLLDYTSDPRLQNPKLEKAEILDLAVEYLQKWTDERNLSSDSTSRHSAQMVPHPPVVKLHHAEPSALAAAENAGFPQCTAQLSSYVHTVTSAQALIQGLRHHQIQQANDRKSGHCSSFSISDLGHRFTDPESAKRPDAASVGVICISEGKEEFLSRHSPSQCSTPCCCLSPPLSPYLSPPLYTTPPAFPSFACHFSFPPKLSPLSSSTTFSTLSHSLTTPVSFSPTILLPGPPAFPLPTLRSPSHNAPWQGPPPVNSLSSMWQPWL